MFKRPQVRRQSAGRQHRRNTARSVAAVSVARRGEALPLSSRYRFHGDPEPIAALLSHRYRG